MYILFVCLFFFFLKKKRIPKIFFQKTPFGHVYFYTRVQQNATCNLYTRPIVSTPHMATWPAKHAAIWPCVYSNRYCRHAAIYSVFCSEETVPRMAVRPLPPLLEEGAAKLTAGDLVECYHNFCWKTARILNSVRN